MSCDTSSCTDIFSSNCVKWDGDDIACLGITKGMPLSDVETLIANKVCLINTGIDVSTVELCDELITAFGTQDKTIANLLQVLATYSCTLRDLITAITGQTNSSGQLVLNYKCLLQGDDPCATPDVSTQGVIQLIIDNFCNLKTQVDTIQTNINNTVTTTVNGAIAGAITTCQPNRVTTTGTGANAKVQLSGFVPPFVALPYFGPLSYFDSTGKGMPNTPMCGFFLCNGLNGTPDLRGRTVVGAIAGMGGGTLSSDVDPALTKNQAGIWTANYSVGDTGGEICHTLTQTQIPNHFHSITDKPHDHLLTAQSGASCGGCELGWFVDVVTPGSPGSAFPDGAYNKQNHTFVGKVLSAYTGITQTNTVGGGNSHENRMPYKACAWIMMVV